MVAAVEVVLVFAVVFGAATASLEMQTGTLGCLQRPYSYKVVQIDDHGRRCWDDVVVTSCWGRCDSREVSDWRFPYKTSYHPVCVHNKRIRATTLLRNCDPGAALGTERYEYLEAASCRCQTCTSSDTSCEGPRHHVHRPPLTPFDDRNFIE